MSVKDDLIPAATDPESKTDQARWFAEEVQPHAASLKSFISRTYPAVRDVEDVVQESFLRVWKASLAKPIAFGKSFLFRVARHVAIDSLRKARNFSDNVVEEISPVAVIGGGPTAPERAELEEKIHRLAEALAQLPELSRQVVILRKFDGLSQKETAIRLGISEGAVEHHVSRGLRRCENYLRKKGINSLYDGKQ